MLQLCSIVVVVGLVFDPITNLIENLNAPDAATRRDAALDAGKLTPGADSTRVLPALRKLLGDDDLKARVLGAIALARLNDQSPGITIALRQGVAVPERTIWIPAAFHLAAYDPSDRSAVGRLADSLKNADGDVRLSLAFNQVASIEEKHDVVTALAGTVADSRENPRKRRASVMQLRAFGSASAPALQILLAALKEGTVDTGQVIAAIGAIGPDAKSAIPALLAALDDEPRNREASILALARIGRSAVPDILKLLSDSSREKQLALLSCLSVMGPDAVDAVPNLVALASESDDRNFKVTVLGTIGAIGPKAQRAVPFLVDALKDQEPIEKQRVDSKLQDQPSVAMYAIRALVAIEATETIPQLRSVLRQRMYVRDPNKLPDPFPVPGLRLEDPLAIEAARGIQLLEAVKARAGNKKPGA